MTQKTIIIILLAAILSAVGIIASIQLYHYHQKREIEQKNAALWQKECREAKARAKEFGYKLPYKCNE